MPFLPAKVETEGGAILFINKTTKARGVVNGLETIYEWLPIAELNSRNLFNSATFTSHGLIIYIGQYTGRGQLKGELSKASLRLDLQ